MEEQLSQLLIIEENTKKSEKGIPTLMQIVKNNHIDYDSCYYISSDEYKRFIKEMTIKIVMFFLTTEAPWDGGN